MNAYPLDRELSPCVFYLQAKTEDGDEPARDWAALAKGDGVCARWIVLLHKLTV